MAKTCAMLLAVASALTVGYHTSRSRCVHRHPVEKEKNGLKHSVVITFVIGVEVG